MDNYRSSEERPEEQIAWSISTENQWPRSPVKSYTCSFCSKGFSSAQALGGHMNIHRKDRAKLRDENILSLDLAKPLNPPDDHHLLQGSEDKSRFPIESTSSMSLKEDAIASSIADLRNSSSRRDDEGSKLKPSSIQKELDLELRLGPDPNERRTREFF